MKNIFKQSFTIKDELYFAKRMSYLLGAGLGLVASLEIVATQMKTARKKKIVEMLIADISSGKTLYESVSQKYSAMSPLSCALIKVGEESASLHTNFKYLAAELSKRQSLQQKIIISMIYPICIMCATLALSLFLIMYIFPKIRPLFISLHVKLPITTRILIAISDGIQKYGIVVFIILTLCIILFFLAFGFHKPTKIICEYLFLKIPGIKTIFIWYMNAVCMHYLHMLLSGNIPLDESIAYITELITYTPYKEAFKTIGKSVLQGSPLHSVLSKYQPIFPKLTTDMISIGEHAGTLSDTCHYLADIYSQNIEETTKLISSSLEPLLMVIMGAIIGFIALSIITPLYAITQNIHS